VIRHPDHESWCGPVGDEFEPAPVTESSERFRGAIWKVRTDRVTLNGESIDRDVIVHPGAVAIIALDEAERVYLLRQYRHPVGMMLFEPPAGVMDRLGEPPLSTARRELVEEAGLEATEWHTLIDFLTSPGSSSEAIRVMLAREITPAPGGRIVTGEAEEVSLPGVWVPLREAVELVLAGRLLNPSSVVGILAAAAAREAGWSTLRPADDPWQLRRQLAESGRVFAFDR